MADDIAATLFAEARARHESARRWFCIVTTLLAVFQVMIFAPYVDLTERKAEAARALAADTRLKQKLDEMAPSLNQLSALSAGEAKTRLDGLLSDLRNTFQRLNGVVDDLRKMGPEKAAGEAGEQPFSAGASSPLISNMAAQIANVQAQAAPMPLPAASRLPLMSGSLRREIAAAGSEDELLYAVRPYIEQEIIGPKFAAFNRSWTDEAAPEVAKVGGALGQQIQAAKSQFPGETATWSSLEQAVSDVVATSRKFKIEPPSDRLWWSQSASKEQAFRGFRLALSVTELSGSSIFVQLQGRVEEAISANRHRQEEIDLRVKELEKEFQAQQSELAEHFGLLKGLSLDLATVAPYVPVILAVAFIALTGMLASRVQELGEAVALMSRDTPESSARQWLRGRMRASLWHRPISILARCAGFAAWVAFASWELARASILGPREAILFALAGGIGLVLAAGYEWRVTRPLRVSPAGG